MILILTSIKMTSRAELIAMCKEKGLKGYSSKNKGELTAMLSSVPSVPVAPSDHSVPSVLSKQNLGQFYTTNSDYILSGLTLPFNNITKIIEPFTGNGDLVEWLKKTEYKGEIEMYDISPKYNETIQQDVLKVPPDYSNSWVITNPPYLARNKCTDKTVYDLYDTNDLYKCFLYSLVSAEGGIIIIPAGFFFSSRNIDVKCRSQFMSMYKITNLNYFEETVFNDTTTTVVAFSFEKADVKLTEQTFEWNFFPSRLKKTFTMKSEFDWIVGGEIYLLPKSTNIRRHVEGSELKKNEQQTFLTISALDSGKLDGRIQLKYTEGYVYPAKDCSRTYATLRYSGGILTADEQIQLANDFNEYLELHREATHSLFLPQFRESKEYARKRIPFELVYSIVSHLIKPLSVS